MLYSIILEKLSEPIYLEKKHRNFLSQTFGVDSNDDIQQFICTDSQDIMTFYDWLLFPTMAFQKKIESVLQGRNISTADHTDLIHRLIKNNIQSKIQLDANTYQVITIEPMIISPFVNRLNLKRRIPDKLIGIHYQDENLKNGVFVYIRNEAIEWTEARCKFIFEIIQSFLDNHQELYEILPQMLLFCGQYQQNFSQELAKRKQHLSQNLERFKNFQSLQQKHSIEYLVSSGIRSIHVDVLQSKAEMAIIDKVLFEVFGENHSSFS